MLLEMRLYLEVVSKDVIARHAVGKTCQNSLAVDCEFVWGVRGALGIKFTEDRVGFCFHPSVDSISQYTNDLLDVDFVGCVVSPDTNVRDRVSPWF